MRSLLPSLILLGLFILTGCPSPQTGPALEGDLAADTNKVTVKRCSTASGDTLFVVANLKMKHSAKVQWVPDTTGARFFVSGIGAAYNDSTGRLYETWIQGVETEGDGIIARPRAKSGPSGHRGRKIFGYYLTVYNTENGRVHVVYPESACGQSLVVLAAAPRPPPQVVIEYGS